MRKRGAKYEGNCGSLRVLSKIICVVISSDLEQSEVGPHKIKLQEVSELVTAPKFDFILAGTIEEYLDMRVEGIDQLQMNSGRPKHHYLAHYADLYKDQGPLIHLWAMRMESNTLSSRRPSELRRTS